MYRYRNITVLNQGNVLITMYTVGYIRELLLACTR